MHGAGLCSSLLTPPQSYTVLNKAKAKEHGYPMEWGPPQVTPKGPLGAVPEGQAPPKRRHLGAEFSSPRGPLAPAPTPRVVPRGLHYITLHYITLHYITLHTLHYIHTYIHYIHTYITYMHTYMQIDRQTYMHTLHSLQ